MLKKRKRALRRSWSVLSFLAFLFQLGLQDEGGADGGLGDQILCTGLQKWLALSGPDIRPAIVKLKLIAQEKAAFKSIAVLNSACVYDMAHQPPLCCTLHHHLYSRMVEQDPGEIIQLWFWNKLDSETNWCVQNWAALDTKLGWKGGEEEWEEASERVHLHY